MDDEELYRRALERILRRGGYQVTCARDAAEALARVSSEPVDLVLCDVKMPGIDGIELVRQIQEIEPDLPCIVITGYHSAENSLEALDAGAFWYLEKPFEHGRLNVIRRLVQTAIQHGRLKTENRALQHQLRSRYKFENIIGKSAALRGVLETVEKVADTDSTVAAPAFQPNRPARRFDELSSGNTSWTRPLIPAAGLSAKECRTASGTASISPTPRVDRTSCGVDTFASAGMTSSQPAPRDCVCNNGPPNSVNANGLVT